MKRYLAFFHEAYGECGGLHDAFDAFFDLSEARVALIRKRNSFTEKIPTSGYIFDLDERKIAYALDDEIIDLPEFGEDLSKKENLSVDLGNRMISFNHKTPEINRNIIYLLGNGVDGVINCQLVRGEYDPNFGDFSKDENGFFKYATYWRYI